MRNSNLKIFFLTIFTAISLTLLHYILFSEDESFLIKKKDFDKKSKKLSRKSTEKSKNINDNRKISRALASKKKKFKRPKSSFYLKFVKVEDRKVIPYGNITTPSTYLNAPKEDWIENYKKVMIQTLPSDFNVKVRHIRSFLQIDHKKRGRFVEEVLVSYKKGGNSPNRFKSLIDSQTGKIIRNYDRTVYENHKKRKVTFTLPSSN